MKKLFTLLTGAMITLSSTAATTYKSIIVDEKDGSKVAINIQSKMEIKCDAKTMYVTGATYDFVFAFSDILGWTHNTQLQDEVDPNPDPDPEDPDPEDPDPEDPDPDNPDPDNPDPDNPDPDNPDPDNPDPDDPDPDNPDPDDPDPDNPDPDDPDPDNPDPDDPDPDNPDPDDPDGIYSAGTDKPGVSQLGDHIMITNLPADSVVAFYTVDGTMLYVASSVNGSEIIPLNNLASGVYILQVNNQTTKILVR